MAIYMSLFVIIISFLTLAHNVNSADFSFPSFDPYNQDITFQGDAFVSDGVLQLTKFGKGGAPLPNSVGRASYATPLRLWDAKRAQLARFSTNFTFVVAPYSPGLYGDGISFFIAPFYSNIPKNSSGGFLGLFSPDTALNAYKNDIVAVEFDSYENPWDPVYSHIGIDVNSIASATTVPWQNGNNNVNQIVAFASINYEPDTKNLSVLVSYPESHQLNQNVSSSSLSFVVDLRTVLPEWVGVGFSGATGQLVEVHKILSWTFSSSFD
ncbi:hypothetical protein RIF29_36400 [Crotalaria pallida]|uniref:Legume lectin domain-containing protein n=1 Tax=Crotalaria pallida TaxID=3830 RepID=A0AAN9EB21_CROPI